MPKITMSLFCSFTDLEAEEKGQQLSTASITYDEVEDAKKTAMKEFTDNLKMLRGTMRSLSKAIRAKGEYREVSGLVRFNHPTVGSKETVRLDTGEVIKTEPMSDAEKQADLFPEDELRELNKMYEGYTERPADDSTNNEESDEEN
jgi:hypothetical protein